MSLLATLKGKGPSGFGYGSTAEEATEGLDLSGRTYLVTGSNSGLADGVRLDAMIFNAGIMGLLKLQQAHGYELQFFTRHIGHFILATGLVGQLAAKGREVALSSSAHQFAPKEGIDFDNLSGAAIRPGAPMANRSSPIFSLR